MVKKLEPIDLGDLFRRRYDALAASAPRPTLEKAVAGILHRVEYLYREECRAMVLGDLAAYLSPHVAAALAELVRLRVLRFVAIPEAYLPGWVSDATVEIFNHPTPGTGSVPEGEDDDLEDFPADPDPFD